MREYVQELEGALQCIGHALGLEGQFKVDFGYQTVYEKARQIMTTNNAGGMYNDDLQKQAIERQEMFLDLYPNSVDPTSEGDIDEQYDQLEYHAPSLLQVAQIARVRDLYKTCARELIQMIPNSRERALALTQNQ